MEKRTYEELETEVYELVKYKELVTDRMLKAAKTIADHQKEKTRLQEQVDRLSRQNELLHTQIQQKDAAANKNMREYQKKIHQQDEDIKKLQQNNSKVNHQLQVYASNMKQANQTITILKERLENEEQKQQRHADTLNVVEAQNEKVLKVDHSPVTANGESQPCIATTEEARDYFNSLDLSASSSSDDESDSDSDEEALQFQLKSIEDDRKYEDVQNAHKRPEKTAVSHEVSVDCEAKILREELEEKYTEPELNKFKNAENCPTLLHGNHSVKESVSTENPIPVAKRHKPNDDDKKLRERENSAESKDYAILLDLSQASSSDNESASQHKNESQEFVQSNNIYDRGPISTDDTCSLKDSAGHKRSRADLEEAVVSGSVESKSTKTKVPFKMKKTEKLERYIRRILKDLQFVDEKNYNQVAKFVSGTRSDVELLVQGMIFELQFIIAKSVGQVAGNQSAFWKVSCVDYKIIIAKIEDVVNAYSLLLVTASQAPFSELIPRIHATLTSAIFNPSLSYLYVNGKKPRHSVIKRLHKWSLCCLHTELFKKINLPSCSITLLLDLLRDSSLHLATESACSVLMKWPELVRESLSSLKILRLAIKCLFVNIERSDIGGLEIGADLIDFFESMIEEVMTKCGWNKATRPYDLKELQGNILRSLQVQHNASEEILRAAELLTHTNQKKWIQTEILDKQVAILLSSLREPAPNSRLARSTAFRLAGLLVPQTAASVQHPYIISMQRIVSNRLGSIEDQSNAAWVLLRLSDYESSSVRIHKWLNTLAMSERLKLPWAFLRELGRAQFSRK